MTIPIPWTLPEEALLRDLCAAGKHRFKDMLPFFPGRTAGSLTGCARKLDIISTYRNPPKYTYNTAYFDDLTLNTCYWAAILQTDGCVIRRGDYITIQWGCAGKDRHHMEVFKTHIRSTHRIRTQHKKCQLSTRDTNQRHEHCSLWFEGAFQWAAALKRHFGFDENKTLRTSPLNLPTLKHKLAYIKGYIDGDGCITQDGTKSGIIFSICGCNKEMIEWIKSVIDSLNLPSLSNREDTVTRREGESCYYWRLGGLSAAILHQLLVRVPTPSLERKWKTPKILPIIDYWKTRPEWPPESFFANLLIDSP